MHLTVRPARLAEIPADALVLGVPEGGASAGLLSAFDAATGGALGRAGFSGKAGRTELLFPLTGLGEATRVALVGLGGEALTAEDWRAAVSAGVDALAGKAARIAVGLPDGLAAAVAAEAAVESAMLTAYRFQPFVTRPDPGDVALAEVVVLSDAPEAEAAASRGREMAEAVAWVRDLANRPGNHLTVPMLVTEATAMATRLGLEAEVFDFARLEREGFGCLAAVGKGSQHKPAFVAITYRGAGEAAPVALVGKGVTFDTGGICIKPRLGMEEMKTDMHGAATVLGTLRVARARKLPVNLVGLLCIAENMPDGNALKPGDVVKAYNGMTVEVVDTDAEGRLVLADGVSYAAKHLAPRAIIDLATLTGSIIVTLGMEAVGLFTNRDALARELAESGTAVGERVWRMPADERYAHFTKSSIADVANVAKGEKGDAIAGAMFIQAFAADHPWVHLDIAGPSYLESPKPYRPKGATGIGVRLLIHWLENHAV